MNLIKKMFNKLTLGMLVIVFGTTTALANVSMLHDFHFDHPAFIHDHPFANRKLVVQVSQDDPARWNLVLNTSQNILNYFVPKNVGPQNSASALRRSGRYGSRSYP